MDFAATPQVAAPKDGEGGKCFSCGGAMTVVNGDWTHDDEAKERDHLATLTDYPGRLEEEAEWRNLMKEHPEASSWGGLLFFLVIMIVGYGLAYLVGSTPLLDYATEGWPWFLGGIALCLLLMGLVKLLHRKSTSI